MRLPHHASVGVLALRTPVPAREFVIGVALTVAVVIGTHRSVPFRWSGKKLMLDSEAMERRRRA
jgi:hypothetical protein